MKKTLVALAVLTAAGSANAGINLYDADGVKVDMSGAAEVQYFQGYAADSDAKIRLDDGDLAINTTIAVSDKMNAVAGIAFEMESGDVTNDELWVGLGGDFGTLTIGRQYLLVDDSGIGKDYELGGDGIDFVQANGDQVIKYVFDNGQFYGGAGALLTETNPAGNADEATVYEGRLGARFGNFDARVYLYSGDDVSTDKFDVFGGSAVNVNIDGYNLEAEYVMDAFAFSASFGQVDYELASDTSQKVDADTAALAGSYTMDKTTFALGYTYWAPEDEDVNVFYANVTQQLHSNVKVYGEIGTSDEKDSEFGYVAGMEVTF
ncbi:porin [Photobacterium profundum]|uniref:OmpH porin-like protein H n=1 Tax=Photobacterium profundum 3TCK TaxID=314280 RepID=Q1Z5S9_9GAMM|nr:porin [Photobacterium profundum]EAS43803.1 OmpH porin-like protein H precursor [Photobacterium profundum 3TCK]PSV64492.1 porin [Photobacterium profundum]